VEQALAFVAVALLVIGLVGQGFELRKMRVTAMKDEDLSSPNMFMHKKNFKWYAIIGAGLVIWYVTGGFTR
jgi:hypothetical protein